MRGPVVMEAKGIVKVLGAPPNQVHALKGVDVMLNSGELTLLMGPSGSGKTTLLSVLGCILAPDQGTVSVAGEATGGLAPEQLAAIRRRHIGFVFQSYNLFPTLSATENVRLALDVAGFPREEARVRAAEALRSVHLTHRAHAYPREMSGGEQQRVAIARAIASAPSVILADEPTAALDGENGQTVMRLLAEIAENQGRAVLAVTHDPRILPFAHRIVTIEDGRITGEQVRSGEAERPAPAGPNRNNRKKRRRHG